MEPGSDLRVCLSLSNIGEHLERYSHIRSQAKQAAIQALEERAGESLLGQRGHKIGHSDAISGASEGANLLETIGGPARIRTWDQRIMSPLL
jgi:hypothetical protein